MNIKKIIILLSVVFTCCIFGSVYAEELPKAELNAVETLQSIGIINEYTPAETITRGEFADVVAGILSKDMSNYSENKYFVDVPFDHKYADEINKLAAYGYILGDHESRFRPQDNISVSEASVVMVRLLGYNIKAQNRGGSMEDYVAEAAEIGVLDGISAVRGTLSKGNAMIMICNALETDLMTMKYNGLYNTSYEIQKDKTLLSEYMEIYYVKDVLTSVGDASISSTFTAGESRIAIGDVVMEADEAKLLFLSDSIGKYVKAYYQCESDGTNVLVGITEQKKSGTKDDTVISLDDLISVSDTAVSYNVNNKQKSMRFEKDARIMYNNRAADVYDLSTLIGKTGAITFIDSLGSGYDIIKINVYEEYVVSEVVASNGTILDKYRIAPALKDLDDEETECEIVDTDGNKKGLDDIAKGNVLSVQTSLNSDYRKIIISKDVAAGKIESLASGKEPSVKIDGKEYKLSESYSKYKDSSLFAGAKITAYLNIFGEIAGIDVNSGDYIVGVLTGAYFYNERDEFSPILKIFGSDSAFHTYEMKVNSKDKVKVNGKNISEDELRSLLNISGNAPEMIPIRYKLNADTKISEIEYDDPSNDGSSDGLRRLGRNITGNQYYRKQSLSFGGVISVKSDAFVFVCPTDRNDTNDFGISTMSYFTNDGSYNMNNIYVMATSKEDYAGSVVMIKRNPSSVVSNSNIAVVLDVAQTVNGDDDVVQQITLLSGGKETTIKAKYGLEFNCKHGDAVQYRTNNSGELIVLEKWAACENNRVAISSSSNSSWHTQGRVMYAVPEEIKNGVAKMTLYNGSEIVGTEYHLLSTFTCYEVDFNLRRNNRVSVCDPSIIRTRSTNPDDYSKLVLQTSWGDGKNMVIYNNWEPDDI